jgi:hypothetical protein
MKKNTKNIIASTLTGIGGAVVGGAVGTLTGIIHTPVIVGLALTAPVSYPAVGIGSALIHLEEYTTGKKVAIGAAIGICMIPLAPINLMSSPLTPMVHAAVGTVAGGLWSGITMYKHLSE